MNENELVVVLGETYQPGTGGRSIQWHKTFYNIEEFQSFKLERVMGIAPITQDWKSRMYL